MKSYAKQLATGLASYYTFGRDTTPVLLRVTTFLQVTTLFLTTL